MNSVCCRLRIYFHYQFCCVRLQLHGATDRPDSFVLMLRYCANLKAIRYESMSLNRIVADKSHRVIVALGYNYTVRLIGPILLYWLPPRWLYCRALAWAAWLRSLSTTGFSSFANFAKKAGKAGFSSVTCGDGGAWAQKLSEWLIQENAASEIPDLSTWQPVLPRNQSSHKIKHDGSSKKQLWQMINCISFTKQPGG